jgi:transcriptional regulator with XRE-family HTH domain
MAKITIKTTKTTKDVLNEYINEYKPTDADLLEIFDVTRQTLWNYKTGFHQPSVKRLYEIAVSKTGEWESKMAYDMLETMGVSLLVQKAVSPSRRLTIARRIRWRKSPTRLRRVTTALPASGSTARRQHERRNRKSAFAETWLRQGFQSEISGRKILLCRVRQASFRPVKPTHFQNSNTGEGFRRTSRHSLAKTLRCSSGGDRMSDIGMNFTLFLFRLHDVLAGMSVAGVAAIVLIVMGIVFCLVTACRVGGGWDELEEKATGRRMS